MMLPHCDSCGNDLPSIWITYVKRQWCETEAKIGISGYRDGDKANVVFMPVRENPTTRDLHPEEHQALCPICRERLDLEKWGWAMNDNGWIYNINKEMEDLL